MSYLIIAEWDENNYPTKVNNKDTEQDAQSLTTKLIDELGYTNAFYVEHPGVGVEYITVDPATKTITTNLNKILDESKNKKCAELKEYYNSKEVRAVSYNNHLIYVTDKAKDGTTELRARLRDNGDITTCEWFFDDGTSMVLDLDGITALNKLIIDKDQNLRKLRFEHKNLINALQSEADIENYDFTTSINGLSWIG